MRRVQALCEAEQITGYPSIRVYRDGSDDILVRGGHHGHEMYRGARTYRALKAFVDGLVTPAGAEPTKDDGMVRPQRTEEPCMHQRCPRSAPMPRECGVNAAAMHAGDACGKRGGHGH